MEKNLLVICQNLSKFNSYKISANDENTEYILNGKTFSGVPDIFYEWIVFIKEQKRIWTHGEFFMCELSKEDLIIPTKVSELENDSEFITSASLPTKVSDLEDSSNYVTKSELDNEKLLIASDITDLYKQIGDIDSVLEKLLNE